MESKLEIVRLIDRITGKVISGVSKKQKNDLLNIGRYAMNLNVDIRLTESQLKQIEEQTKTEVDNAIMHGQLDSYIKEVVKSCVKVIVNEEIQTKGYRKLISERVTEVLMNEGMVK